MTALVLHLSDIHIKTAKDPILKRSQEIAASVTPSLPAATHVFIVVSGDIAYSGAASEYDLAKQFLEEIRQAIAKESDLPISFVIAPGNHDCDFQRADMSRKLIVDGLEKDESPQIDNSIIDICTGIQSDFFSFRESLEDNPAAEDDKLWRTSHFTVEDKKLEFDCLNISWMSVVSG